MFKKRKFLSYILYAIGEITLIVIGILLALYLQNKNEEKKITESVNSSINMLKDEINANQNMINSVKEYHIMVRDTLADMELSKTEIEKSRNLGFWQGMRTPRLQNAAFQTSIQSGISKELNQILLKSLNHLYTFQEGYNDFTSQATQIFFNADFTDQNKLNKLMATIKITMNDLYFYEKELSKIYDRTLRSIDSISNNN